MQPKKKILLVLDEAFCDGLDLGSNDNLIEDNDYSYLEIKTPVEYSDSHVDGRMFTV